MTRFFSDHLRQCLAALGRLARFKHPRIIDFHEALPREDSGKIFKPRLRAPYWEGAGRSI